jgi:Na+-driven multidrug efflux pump
MAVRVWKTSERGVWWAMVAAATVEVTLTYLWFRRGTWKDRVV